jgi:transglutaminase-like putative cysteine protease
VSLSRQLLHLTPRETPGQHTLDHHITVNPVPAERGTRRDYFGNLLEHFAVGSAHEELVVVAESTIEVTGRDEAGPPVSPAWEFVRDRLHQVGPAPLLEPSQYLYASPHVEPMAALARYARLDFHRGRPLFESASALMQRIHRDFEFDPEATTVSTPLETLLREKRGVCQDFAHLMIGSLRSLGLPARYVSGYLLTNPPSGQARLIGADASHAWIAVYCPVLGWVDFDPTNNVIPSTEHITLAWGRDFSDVSPLRGVILGGGQHELDVRVTVMPASERR